LKKNIIFICQFRNKYYLCIVFEAKNIVLLFNLEKKMKKLVLLLAVVFSVSLFSCGGAATEAAATDSVAADSVVADSAAADTVVADTTVADSVK
jgi:hypothetical protein